MQNLSLDLGKLKLKNPVLTASGTFGYGLEYSSFGDLSKLGGIITKGLSLHTRQGNFGQRACETPCGIINSIGLQNIGVKSFVQDKLPYLPWQNTPIITNIYGNSISEFEELADYLAAYKEIAGLELNISCPNVSAGGMLFGQDPDLAGEVCQKVKSKAGEKPVIVKLTPNTGDIVSIARAVQDAKADIISLINTISAMEVDIESKTPVLGNVKGGLSGPCIKPIALRMVHDVCQNVQIPVIGVGGICSPRDILEFILVGAHAVEVGSINFSRPDASFQLVDELARLTREMDINSWEEFRGKLHFRD